MAPRPEGKKFYVTMTHTDGTTVYMSELYS